MKIQINGFDLEINTDEANLSVKVMDANGKELSNNTYTQTSETSDEVTDVDMPTADTVEPEGSEEGVTEETPEESTEETTEETSDETTAEELPPIEGEEGEENEEDMGESFVFNLPDFETFKQNLKK